MSREYSSHVPENVVILDNFFKFFQKRLYNLCLRELNKYGVKNLEDVAPDILQDVFITALKRRYPLPEDKVECYALPSWYVQSVCYFRMQGTAANKVGLPKNPLKVKDKHTVQLSVAGVSRVPDPNSYRDVDDRFFVRDLRAVILNLRNLSDLEKQVCVSILFDNTDRVELAQKLNIKRKYLDVVYQKGLLKLQRNPRFRQLFIKGE